MIESTYSTRVKAPDTHSSRSTSCLKSQGNESNTLNPSGSELLDRSSAKGRKQFLRPNKLLSFGQLNCRTLSSLSSKKELNKLVYDHNITITCIQEHRIIHADDDPYIVHVYVISSKWV